MFQVSFNIASLAAFEMIVEYFNRRTRSHSSDAQANVCVAVSISRQKFHDATIAQRMIRRMKRENPTVEICPGITRRTVAHGDTMYQMLATLAAGSQMPAHSHPQEQIVHILEGKMRLIVGGVPHELSAGESFYLASNVAHGVETLAPTRVLDTFSPPRADYLAIDEKVLHGAL
jgi:quercetin dioxygenase-like cupin family protein